MCPLFGGSTVPGLQFKLIHHKNYVTLFINKHIVSCSSSALRLVHRISTITKLALLLMNSFDFTVIMTPSRKINNSIAVLSINSLWVILTNYVCVTSTCTIHKLAMIIDQFL